MILIAPRFVLTGSDVVVTVGGLPNNFAPFEFRFASGKRTVALPSIDVAVVPQSIRSLTPTSYSFRIRVASGALPGPRTVVARASRGTLDIGQLFVIPFFVKPGGLKLTSLLPPRGTAAPASPTSLSPPASIPLGASGCSPPPDVVQAIFSAEARIFTSEAEILEALTKEAKHRICDTDWLKAAAAKEHSIAELIRAWAKKEKVLARSCCQPQPSPPLSSTVTPIPPPTVVPPPLVPPSITVPPTTVVPPDIVIPDDILNKLGGLPPIERPEDGEDVFAPPIVTEPPVGIMVPDVPQETIKAPFLVCPCCSGDGDGVASYGNRVLLHSGEERLDRVDLEIPGRGQLHFLMRRRYRSRLRYNGPLGYGWDYLYNERLFLQPNGDVVRANGLSHVDRWLRRPDGTFVAPRGNFHALLQLPNGGYVLRSPDGMRRNYSPKGRLVALQDRFHNVMRLEYGPRGNLARVIDVFGRPILFEFQSLPTASDGYVDRLVLTRDFIGREVHYTYDLNGDLTAVTGPAVTGTPTDNDFPNGRTERYTYSSGYQDLQLNHKLLTVTAPEEVAMGGQPRLQLSYGVDPSDFSSYGKVINERYGGTNDSAVSAGGSTTFQYQAVNAGVPLDQPNVARKRVLVTERNGNLIENHINEKEDLIQTLHLTRGFRQREHPFYATRYEYDEEGLRTREIKPEGNEELQVYDRSGVRAQQWNVVERRLIADGTRSGGNDIVTTFEYEPLYNLVSRVVDPRGNDDQFQPPLGVGGRDRYTTHYFYDYQQGSDDVPEALEFGIGLDPVPRGLGDLNDDGTTDGQHGDLVRIEEPTVQLAVDSSEASSSGSAAQTVVFQFQYNDRGQPTKRIDARGNVTNLVYYPEDDPAGVGRGQPGTSAPLRGYLRDTIVDAEVSSRRLSSAPATQLNTSFEYDEVGNLVAITNPRCVRTEIVVNQLNEIVVLRKGAEVADAKAAGQLLTEEVPYRYEARHHYDHNGRIVRREVANRDGNTDGLGPWIEHRSVYDILDQPLQSSVTVDATNVLTTKYRYDENELLVEITQPEGNIARTRYDERNLPLEFTRGAGVSDASTFRLDYDSNGNVLIVYGAEPRGGDGKRKRTRVGYDGFDRQVRLEDALGNVERRSYDPASNLIRIEIDGHPPGQPNASPVRLLDERCHFDELDRMFRLDQAVFLSQGFTTVRSPEISDADSDGLVTTRWDYDPGGLNTFAKDDDGDLEQFTYDGADRLVGEVDPVCNRVIYEYDNNDNPTRVTLLEFAQQSGVQNETFVTDYVYDQLDRLTRATDNAGQTIRFEYDSRDNLVSWSDPEGPPVADPLGLISRVRATFQQINSAGNTTRFFYDGIDRLIREVVDLREDGRGGNALDMRNPFNPAGLIAMRYVYDGNSRVTAIEDANGNRTMLDYDALDRVITSTQPDGTRYKVRYDRDHNVREVRDPNGSVIRKQFDAIDRLSRVTVERGRNVVGTTIETYEYDGLSRLTRATDDNGESLWTQISETVYDSLSRVIEERQNGKAIASVYSGAGDCIRFVFPDGRRLFHTFDGLGRVLQTKDDRKVILERSFIGPDIRELVRTYGNGTMLSFLNDQSTASSGYDAVRRITRLSWSLASGANFLDREYTYNRADQRLSEQRNDDNGLVDRYTYDSNYRLVGARFDDGCTNASIRRLVRQIRYLLDPAGNRRQVLRGEVQPTRSILDVNELNEYVRIDGVPLTFDDNGNLLTDGQRRHVYDCRNRLVSVFTAESNEPVAHYLYDTGNRRRRKRVFNQDGEAKSDTVFYYDDWQVCEERSADDRVLVSFVYADLSIDEPVQLVRGEAHPLGSGVLYLHQNTRGDVVAVTEETGGQVIERRVYDDFGLAYDEAKVPAAVSQVGNPYGFHGRRYDEETGLYYFRNRYYSPDLGRFIQRDTVRDPINFGNAYSFVANRVASVRDPFGEEGWLDWVQGGLDVAGFIPGVGALPDVINAGISLARGNVAEAGISLVAAVPLFGDAVKGVKMGVKGLDKLNDIRKVTKTGDKLVDANKAAKATETVSAAKKGSKGKGGSGKGGSGGSGGGKSSGGGGGKGKGNGDGKGKGEGGRDKGKKKDKKKPKKGWRCTSKARHICPPHCKSAIFEGIHKDKATAKAMAEGKCHAAGCHSPGGTIATTCPETGEKKTEQTPFSCNCGHSTCHRFG